MFLSIKIINLLLTIINYAVRLEITLKKVRLSGRQGALLKTKSTFFGLTGKRHIGGIKGAIQVIIMND